MIRDEAAVGRVGVERVRIVAESRDSDAGLLDQLAQRPDARFAEVADVEVADAGIAALRPAGRPAHQLNAVEALVVSEGQNLVQRQVAEDRADEAELHDHPQRAPIGRGHLLPPSG